LARAIASASEISAGRRPARDDERQEALVGLPTIALDEKGASRFLKALERPDGRTVAKLADLRRRV
jgi:hypothetical protein